MRYSVRGRPGLVAKVAAVATVLGATVAAGGWTGASHSQASSAEPASSAPSPAADTLNGVAALGELDAWAVGTRFLSSHEAFLTLTEHWDGANWNVVPSPSPEGIGEQTASILGAVAMDAPNDVWAVGSRSPASTDPRKIPPSHGLIEHYNGVDWTVVPGPSSGGHVTELTGVAAISKTAAWAIGMGKIGGHSRTILIRWNGKSWRFMPSPPGTDLSSMAVVSAGDIWVAGTTDSKSTFRTLAEHWNGSKWTIVPTPNGFKGRTRNSVLAAVGASSHSNAWAVGWYQSGATSFNSSTLVERWGGAKWQLQPSANGPDPKAENHLDAISATSRKSAWAAGSTEVNNKLVPLIERWDGVSWAVTPSTLQAGVTGAFLNGIAGVHPRYAWAVGEALDKNRNPITLIEKWNGTGWKQVSSPNP